MVIIIVKDKKNSIKDTMSIKFSFMHYMKWTRVILPVALDEFELFFIFLAIFLFSPSLSIGERSTLAKTWGEGR